MKADLVHDLIMEQMINHFRIRDFALEDSTDPKASRILRRSRVVGSSVYFKRKAVRLMDLARSAIREQGQRGRTFPTGTVFMAQTLTGARGRLARSWWAPEGGIYLCIVLYPVLLEEHWHLYSLGAGVAVAQVLREWGVDARLRWVNDVLVKGRKVAGILTETSRDPEGEGSYILIGLGVNVNTLDFPPELPEAGSLSLATGRKWPVRALAAHILARTGWVFGSLEEWEAGHLDQLEWVRRPQENPVVRSWKQINSTLGKRVVYGLDVENAPELRGTAVDMDPDGGLKIQTDSGEVITVWSGEVRYLGPSPGDMPR